MKAMKRTFVIVVVVLLPLSVMAIEKLNDAQQKLAVTAIQIIVSASIEYGQKSPEIDFFTPMPPGEAGALAYDGKKVTVKMNLDAISKVAEDNPKWLEVVTAVVAAHEMGHLILGHHLELYRKNPPLARRIEMEHEADAKAVEVLQKSRNLEQVQAFIWVTAYHYQMKEFLKRNPELSARDKPYGHDDPCEKLFDLYRRFPQFSKGGTVRPCS